MITLYYIEGIDRENIPYVYPAYKEQITIQDYLTKCIVASIPNSYYPPYYRNIISVSSEDFTGNFLKTSINYLSLSFGDKEYYYFIDRIEYVNEDLYKLHITMDVIMTYINEIKIHGGIIERKFIDRWINNRAINRAYKRENASNGLFQLTQRKYLSKRSNYDGEYKDNVIDGIFVIRTTENPWKPDGTFPFLNGSPSTLYSDSVNFSSRYATYIVPYISDKFSSTIQYEGDKEGVYTSRKTTTALSLYHGLSHPTVVDCRYYPINLFEDYFWFIRRNNTDCIVSTDILNWCLGKEITPTPGLDYNYELIAYLASKLTIKPIKGSYTFILNKPTNKNKPFTSEDVPALIDENYIRLSYGDGEVQATAQLYLITIPTIEYNYKYDINNAARYYWFTATNSVVIRNERVYGQDNSISSLAINENPITLDLVNDAWGTWKAYNSATLPLTMGKTALDIGKFALDTYITYKNPMAGLLANSGFVDKRFKTPTLNKKGQRELFNIQSNESEDIREGLYNIATMPGRFENIINSSKEPDTSKSSGNFTTAISSEGMNIRMDIYKVNDYEQCAQYYHRNGYLVDEYINEMDSVFDYVSTRYYYNVLKMRDVDITLINSPASTEILELIRERLENGIRLWNCNATGTFVTIGNYAYDNIERSNLNE